MAKGTTKTGTSGASKKNEQKPKRTSIGRSINTKPKNKNKKKSHKPYRGQGTS